LNVRCEHLSVRYGEGGTLTALNDVTLSLPEGSRALLLGRAASGKTTLLKALAGLLVPAEGAVLWDQDSTASLSVDARRIRQAEIGFVFQTDALFDSMSVLDNVLLPLSKRRVPRAEAYDRAMAALQAVELDAAAKKRPEELSGGMRKRAGIARAIVTRPALLLADDPLAGLDPATALHVSETLAEVSHGKTLVVSLPEPVKGLETDRWLFLERGRLLHDGAPRPELLDVEQPWLLPA
jgi:phospholipid/cholesterol/gamma-HCH transport system ATP-binding protein